MKVLIAEDEELARTRLIQMLKTIDSDVNITAIAESKRELKEHLLSANSFDLLILDIELGDGKSLELFEEIDIKIPIIFITAFDQYAIEAFKHLSLGYLLKPIVLRDLKTVLSKIEQFNVSSKEVFDSSSKHYETPLSFKEKLMLKIGDKYFYRDVSDALYFFADNKDVSMLSKTDYRKFPLDVSLDTLENQLDPSKFFRISRKYIVHIDTIKELRGLPNVRLEIRSEHPLQHNLLVSRSKMKAFKAWLNR